MSHSIIEKTGQVTAIDFNIAIYRMLANTHLLCKSLWR